MSKMIKKAFDSLHSLGFHKIIFAPLAFAGVLFAVGSMFPKVVFGAVLWIAVSIPVILPLSLIIWLPNAWLLYVQSKFIFKREKILLKMQIPSTLIKSPKAMEMVFNDIIVKQSVSTFIDIWWKGGVKPIFSFELVSIEGRLYFYINCPKGLRYHVESAIYAQYPEIEITEVSDYTSGVYFDYDKLVLISFEYQLKKPNCYPIKTYSDYNLDKDPPKYEQRIDPISSLFENLSSLGPGEQMWIQILCQLHTTDEIRDEAQKEIEKIYESLVEEERSDKVKAKGKSILKPQQQEQVDALTKSLDKLQVDVGIRMLYLSKPEAFKPSRIPRQCVQVWRPFASNILNSIVPMGRHDHAVFDYPWQDYKKIREKRTSKKMLDAYKRREFFNPPYVHRHMVMTPEELATIYHFPTEEIKTPGLQRIQSRKSGAPPNLPV